MGKATGGKRRARRKLLPQPGARSQETGTPSILSMDSPDCFVPSRGSTRSDTTAHCPPAIVCSARLVDCRSCRRASSPPSPPLGQHSTAQRRGIWRRRGRRYFTALHRMHIFRGVHFTLHGCADEEVTRVTEASTLRDTQHRGTLRYVR